ncbi:AraC family transcriptional regulator [Blastopirellula marina]|uniref:Transcriptional regulator, AraC family protein n=1 Tax=Blastopirellula marina DSM 3645 TaxID=314230 RepID=A3ZMZ0_9BACT|nr:AraC family transcriptional regulator [Blastopirellula marina]EAQ82319.1 transcriptional regulator, AraC family protein [Blastopirellula marina DSM 3645]
MNATRQRYEAKILRVQLLIQHHLDEDLSLEHLAAAADYSPCHFHRIFRGIVGESADDYVRRLRMERAAQSLRYRRRSVLDIALDAGYGSHEAFTRAFVRTFGVTPSDYQSLEHPPASIKETLMSTVNYTAAHVRLETQPSRRLAYIRVVGKYDFENLNPAFGRILQFAAENNLMTDCTACVGVYHDDPDVTAPEKQRADVGVTVDDQFQPTGEIQVQTIPSGKCAVLRHQGHYDTLHEAYRWFFSVWLPDSGHEPGDFPAYEIYVNDASQLPPDQWLTDICVPLAE